MCDVDGCGSAGLPEDLECAVVDANYAATLAAIDRDRLCGGDALRLAHARNRLVSWAQAELYADLHTVARAEPVTDRVTSTPLQASRYPWAECEVAFALRWTTVAAGARLEHARALREDLPQLWRALATGEVDLPKAQVIIDAVAVLTDPALARQVVDRVLEHAHRLTTGQLRARLRRLVISVDDHAAVRRAARAVRDRRVEVTPHPDGSGEIAGVGLPPQDTAAAWDRLTTIARAAKSAGDRRTMDQLRADALLDLLLGEGIAVGNPLTDHTLAAPTDTAAPAPEPADATPPTEAPAPGPTGATTDRDPASPREPSTPPAAGDLAPDPAVSAATRSTPPPATPAAPRSGAIELQVSLETLAGLADLPGELTGYGPVAADIARQIAARHATATWRYSVYDRLGELIYHGTTTARPHRRHPTNATAAFVKARDRTCVAPGCRQPARTADLDHTIAHADGGPTEIANLGVLCRRHHRFKHASGAELIQLESGTFAWRTPLGRTYITTQPGPLIRVS